MPVFYDSLFIGVVCAANISRQGSIDGQEHLYTVEPGASDFQQEFLWGLSIVGDPELKPEGSFAKAKAYICGIGTSPGIVRKLDNLLVGQLPGFIRIVFGDGRKILMAPHRVQCQRELT